MGHDGRRRADPAGGQGARGRRSARARASACRRAPASGWPTRSRSSSRPLWRAMTWLHLLFLVSLVVDRRRGLAGSPGCTTVADATRGHARAARRRPCSDPGRVRTNNEDLPVLDAERGIFGVIDGVGGHAAGELAAAIARDVILQRLARPLGTPAERVREAIAIANNEIFRRAAAEPELAGHDLRGHARGRQRRPRDRRPCRRQPPLQAAAVRPAQADARPLAGRRARGRAARSARSRRCITRAATRSSATSAARCATRTSPSTSRCIEDTLEDDAAILRVQRRPDRHDSVDDDRARRARCTRATPAAVTTALVAAANEAGGRDNVTVVYAEAPGFAAALKAGTTTDPASRQRPCATAPTPRRARRADRPRRQQPHHVVRRRRRCSACCGALLLAWRLSSEPPVGGTHDRRRVAGVRDGRHARGGRAVGARRRRHPPRAWHLCRVDRRARRRVAAGARARALRCSSRPASATGEWVAIIAPATAGGAISGVR